MTVPVVAVVVLVVFGFGNLISSRVVSYVTRYSLMQCVYTTSKHRCMNYEGYVSARYDCVPQCTVNSVQTGVAYG